MYERIVIMKELLSDTGVLYIHCDWHKGHYIKCIMDELFGADNFINEITWYYYNKMAPKSSCFPRTTDKILVYSKTPNYVFNTQYERREKPIKQLVRKFVDGKAINARDENGNVMYKMPKNKPQIVTIPKANYIAVRGKGNPNEEGGEYKTAIGVLYAVAYTLKMSYKTDYKIEGFFEYVVPPLEGFWWQDNVESIDYTDKSAFNWISVIRLPDFITKKDFDWAVETASKKKKMDCSGAEFLSIDEGLCVQIMHIGAFDDEPATVAMMDKYLEENGYVNDFTDERRHHEIYLSDPRKVAPEKCKTVIRHPIKKA